MPGSRRFRRPWTVEETAPCFIVRDANGQALAFVYREYEPRRRTTGKLLTRDEAPRIAANIAKLADVQKLANDWMNVYNKKDAATIANLYTNDGIFSNPGWTASGRATIEDALNKSSHWHLQSGASPPISPSCRSY